MENPQVSQLMHLGALAFAVAAGYVGLDRIPNEKDKFRDDLKTSCNAAKEFITAKDLQGAGWAVQKVYLIHPVFVLVMVSGLPFKLPLLWRAFHCCRRQFKLPLLNFIRSDRDVRLMATLCILDLIALIAVAAVGMWPDHADRVLTWHPVWVLSLATSYTGLVFAYFFFRAEFVRSKFATGMLFAFCGLLTLLSLIFETASRHWAAILEPHAGDVVFFQFAFTLIAAVSLVACSYRLREAQTVFEGYKSRMKQRFDTLAAMSLSHIAADLHSVQDNLGAASGTDRTVLGLQALPGASGSSPPADPAQPGAYGPGDRVFHVKFGYGRVTLVDGNKLTIEFEKIGERRVIDLFVRRV